MLIRQRSCKVKSKENQWAVTYVHRYSANNCACVLRKLPQVLTKFKAVSSSLEISSSKANAAHMDSQWTQFPCNVSLHLYKPLLFKICMKMTSSVHCIQLLWKKITKSSHNKRTAVCNLNSEKIPSNIRFYKRRSR